MEPSFLGKVSLSAPERSPTPTLPPQKKKRFTSIILPISAVILLIVIGGVLLFTHRHNSHTVSNISPSLTLYYDDGKTTLWHRGSTDSPKTQAPYFVALVEAELQQKYGQDYLSKGAWSVTTTLDPTLQPTAEKLVADNSTNMQARAASEAALVLQDVKTGQIKALVGGTSPAGPDQDQTNYADTLLPGGSSMIPFSYAALINDTTTTGAGSPIDDTQGPLFGYPCTNTGMPAPEGSGNCAEDYDFKYPGTLSVRYALGGDRKIPAIKAMLGGNSSSSDNNSSSVSSIKKTLGLIDTMTAPNAYQCFSDQALTKPTQCYDAAAVGDGAYITLLNELNGLSTIANNGIKTSQTTIASVRLNGKNQAIPGQAKNTQVIKPDTAYILNNISSDPNASYLPGNCTAADCSALTSGGYKFQRYQGWDFAVDPGTNSNGSGATMASWSTQYAAISWVGNTAQNKPITSPGEFLTEPLTRNIMEAAHTGKQPVNWQPPKDIQTLPAFVVTQPTSVGTVVPSPSTDIYPAWYKQN